MALLSNNRLAAGSYDNFIYIWDLNDNHKLITKLSGHKRSVVALKTISNERLVSYSYDDTVKIWDTFSNSFSLLVTISGHGNSRSWLNNKLYPYFGVLSNQNIVTCSWDSKTDCELRLWDSNDGRLLESISTQTKEISTMFILNNDQVLICAKDMSVCIFDFFGQVKSRKLRISLNERIYSIAQLKNGDLISSGSSLNDFLTVWNLNSKKAIQNIYVGHSKKIYNLSLSADQTLLATCSDDSSVRIFRIQEATSI